MIAMSSQIELYEEISTLSADMVEAARENDWDRLVDLEQKVQGLRDALAAGDDAPLDSRGIERKRELIHRILEDDAEIRRHTEPWMEHVRQFLGLENRRRQVANAYAAGSGNQGGHGGAFSA